MIIKYIIFTNDFIINLNLRVGEIYYIDRHLLEDKYSISPQTSLAPHVEIRTRTFVISSHQSAVICGD